MTTLFVGDQNKRLELEFQDYEIVNGELTLIGPLDISGASEITFLFKKPDDTPGTSKTKTGGTVVFTNTGTDGKAYYDTEDGFLDMAGTWQRQGTVVIGGKTHHSAIVNFLVSTPLS